MSPFIYVMVIGFMGLIILIMLALPALMNVPFYLYLKAKLTNSMVIFLLRPDKKIDMVLAKPRSSIIETKKNHYHFLSVPDAIYMLFGIPSAIAYHKYGAILPAQNIIHATEMRDKGFKNIGEVEEAIAAYKFALYGDKKTEGLEDIIAQLEEATKKKSTPEQKAELEAAKSNREKYMKELEELEGVFIEKSGFIKIQDIFNFLNKNLSTDIIFSVIERSVAEEMRGMRDLTAKFISIFPYILTLFVFLIIGIMVVMSISDGGGGVNAMLAIPKIGP